MSQERSAHPGSLHAGNIDDAVSETLSEAKRKVGQAALTMERGVDQAVEHARVRIGAAADRVEEVVGSARQRMGAAADRVEDALEDTVLRTRGVWRRTAIACVRWFDTSAIVKIDGVAAERIDWVRVIPFIGLHAACLGVIWVGFSWFALAVAAGLYALRMFAITGFYHRYFSHRTFKTTRVLQFVFALIGASSVQRGPLWWAAHHRHHHRFSDQPQDLHSPVQHGFWKSHMGWFLTPRAFGIDWKAIPDLEKFPELKFLDRFDILVPIALAGCLFGLGELLQSQLPQLHTNGPQLLIWGFFVSTVTLFHATVTINSLSHVWGTRRYETRDASRNNLWLALLTFGEGWHNNHHHYPGAARQGFYWWEIDMTWYALKLLSWVGLIWDLKPVPERIRATTRRHRPA